MSTTELLELIRDLSKLDEPRHTPEQWDALLADVDAGRAHE